MNDELEEFTAGLSVLCWAARTGQFELMIPEEWDAAGNDGDSACIAQQLYAEMEWLT